jgi:hypothetical protein
LDAIRTVTGKVAAREGEHDRFKAVAIVGMGEAEERRKLNER